MHVQSVDAPGDPLVAFMRARGMMMDFRFCNNGSVMPPEWISERINPDMPLWTVGALNETAASLANATAMARAHQAQKVRVGARVLCSSAPAAELNLPLPRADRDLLSYEMDAQCDERESSGRCACARSALCLPSCSSSRLPPCLMEAPEAASARCSWTGPCC